MPTQENVEARAPHWNSLGNICHDHEVSLSPVRSIRFEDIPS